jgi:hypothetical protein
MVTTSVRSLTIRLQVYQYNSTTLQVPTVLVRPLFGWKEVDSFSVTDEERERPAADIYTTAE